MRLLSKVSPSGARDQSTRSHPPTTDAACPSPPIAPRRRTLPEVITPAKTQGFAVSGPIWSGTGSSARWRIDRSNRSRHCCPATFSSLPSYVSKAARLPDVYQRVRRLVFGVAFAAGQLPLLETNNRPKARILGDLRCYTNRPNH